MLPILLLPMLLQLAPVQWTLSSPKLESALKPGERLEVVLDAEIAEGWHLYSLKKLEGGPIPTSISLPEGQPFRLAGEIEASAPLSKFDDTFQMDVESYSYSASFKLPVEVAKDASSSATLTVNARFQACDDKQCLPPRTVKVQLPLNVKP
jgi:thiol:disulfide interchange protein DsbD